MRHMLTTSLMAMAFATSSLADSATQPYAGLETRDIAALSASDIAELQAGRGWGLALPAELNGYPGPTHVLEHAAELGLSETQRTEVVQIFEDMQSAAIAAGNALIAAERALDLAFRDKTVTAAGLRSLVSDAAEARGNLRYVHLSRHLTMLSLLSPAQVVTYNTLRGYGDYPCAAVPEGHDATMWRQHYGCDG